MIYELRDLNIALVEMKIKISNSQLINIVYDYIRLKKIYIVGNILKWTTVIYGVQYWHLIFGHVIIYKLYSIFF